MANFSPSNEAINELKGAHIVTLNVDAEPSGYECISILREDLSVEVLNSKGKLFGPTTLFSVIRDYLVQIGFKSEQLSTTNKLTRGIAHCFFEEDKAQYYALVKLQALLSVSVTKESRTPNRAPVISTDNGTFNNEDNVRKSAHNISQLF